jgi:hypothetical protein
MDFLVAASAALFVAIVPRLFKNEQLKSIAVMLYPMLTSCKHKASMSEQSPICRQ